jgi:hypothetical protein
MTRLFAKLIGVKTSNVQPMVAVYCLQDYRCPSPYEGTYYEINGKPVFQHCGC